MSKKNKTNPKETKVNQNPKKEKNETGQSQPQQDTWSNPFLRGLIPTTALMVITSVSFYGEGIWATPWGKAAVSFVIIGVMFYFMFKVRK